MSSKIRTFFIWAAAALFCVGVLNLRAHAESLDPDIVREYSLGPGDHYDENGNIVSISGELLVSSESIAAGGYTQRSSHSYSGSGVNFTTETSSDGETVYVFEGKKYTQGAYWGIHKLSGYSPSETGTLMTASGLSGCACHTVAASSELPLGTVIIVRGISGPYASDYDGMYVVEDRGGYYIEDEQWLDIFCDSYEEAVRVTDAGWNQAEVWIAVPLS